MLSFCCGATGREGVGDSDKGIKAFMVTHAQSLNKTDVSPSRVKGVRMVEVGGGWHSFGDVKVDPSPRGVPPELAPPRSPRPSRPWDDRQRGSPRRGGRKDENKRDRGGSWGGARARTTTAVVVAMPAAAAMITPMKTRTMRSER